MYHWFPLPYCDFYISKQILHNKTTYRGAVALGTAGQPGRIGDVHEVLHCFLHDLAQTRGTNQFVLVGINGSSHVGHEVAQSLVLQGERGLLAIGQMPGLDLRNIHTYE